MPNFSFFSNGNNIGITSNTVGSNSVAIGNNATAGILSVALGASNTTASNTSVAIGTNATSLNDSIAIGYAAKNLHNGIAIGDGAITGARDNNGNIKEEKDIKNIDKGAIAIGQDAKAISGKSIAIGQNSDSSYHGIAIGNNTRAKDAGIAIGSKYNSLSNDDEEEKEDQVYAGNEAIAIGVKARADFDGSIAIGNNAQILYQLHGSGDKDHNGIRSIAIGENSKCLKMDSVAIGSNALASKDNSVAIGTGAETTTSNQIVLGRKSHKDNGHDVPATTVYIPGNLVVDGSVYLGRDTTSNVYSRIRNSTGENGKALDSSSFINLSYWSKGDGSTLRQHYLPKTEDFVNKIDLSDRRLKNVGKAFTSGLAEIKKLEVFNYTFKKDESKTPRVGVMAQDLQKIFPNAVTKGEDGFLRIRMEDMFYAVVNAVKELDNKFDLLAQKQKKIDELEAKLDKLEKRLEKLEKQK